MSPVVENFQGKNLPSYLEFADAKEYLHSASFQLDRRASCYQTIADVIEYALGEKAIRIVTWERYVFLTNYKGNLSQYQENRLPILNNITRTFLEDSYGSLYFFTKDTQIKARERIIQQIGEDFNVPILTLDEVADIVYGDYE